MPHFSKIHTVEEVKQHGIQHGNFLLAVSARERNTNQNPKKLL